jgi:hypothetical protein
MIQQPMIGVIRETLPTTLQKVYSGQLFKLAFNLTLGAPGTLNYEFKTPVTKNVHMVAQSVITASTTFTLKFVENGIKADGVATGFNPYNVNRLSNSTTAVTFLQLATSSTGGSSTLINSKINANEMWTESSPEIILKKNSGYLMQFIKTGTTSARLLNIKLLWYEDSN